MTGALCLVIQQTLFGWHGARFGFIISINCAKSGPKRFQPDPCSHPANHKNFRRAWERQWHNKCIMSSLPLEEYRMLAHHIWQRAWVTLDPDVSIIYQKLFPCGQGVRDEQINRMLFTHTLKYRSCDSLSSLHVAFLFACICVRILAWVSSI